MIRLKSERGRTMLEEVYMGLFKQARLNDQLGKSTGSHRRCRDRFRQQPTFYRASQHQKVQYIRRKCIHSGGIRYALSPFKKRKTVYLKKKMRKKNFEV